METRKGKEKERKRRKHTRTTRPYTLTFNDTNDTADRHIQQQQHSLFLFYNTLTFVFDTHHIHFLHTVTTIPRLIHIGTHTAVANQRYDELLQQDRQQFLDFWLFSFVLGI